MRSQTKEEWDIIHDSKDKVSAIKGDIADKDRRIDQLHSKMDMQETPIKGKGTLEVTGASPMTYQRHSFV